MDAAATDGRAATTLRTFVAIDLPDAVKQEFAVRRDALRSALAAQGVAGGLRWSDPRGLHLTLRFLGETTPAQCQALARSLREVAGRYGPFRLQLGAPGVFPNAAQPRVLWVGLGGDVARLVALQAQVEARVQALGFAAEPKPFAPHITLARVGRDAGRAEVQALGRVLTTLWARAEPVAASSFVVTRLIHYRSELRRGGAVYTPLADIPLMPD